ncbi:PEP-CTERM sorting domain-containing protein [Paucibacter sp. APW11]|uniref:PEP-CTERM sorting domain-containing protein n=1 Tax=Roseateles aquae TaxID=3077235 RepID=A0ABU3P824_9BURK|nr:PEP-CTERM sorting domain-containing protein [Paucibacter sp. APW11]MDT8998699.1 PEP-CTERM sorting domain-containing protein [Paucibacter sp. APW11]
MKLNTLSIMVAALAAAGSAEAGLSVDNTGYNYSQSFDTLAASGSAVAWANDSTLAGWSLFKTNTTTPVTSYIADTGSSNTGGIHSYGSTAERALGGLGSNSFNGWIAVAFSNATGKALDGFKLSFDGEQWRNGGNTSKQTMTLQYGFGSSFASVSNWVAPGGNFDWSSPLASSTAAAVNGNTVGLLANRGGTVNTNWAAGSTLWVRWVENNDVGNDHGLAIDNVKFSVVSSVPEPQTYALLLAGLAGVGFVARRRKA